MTDEHQALLPKDGLETSSYRVALYAICAPVAALFILVAALLFTHDQSVREALIDLIKYVVSAGILASAAAVVRYIASRGNIAVAKTEAFRDVTTAQIQAQTLTTNATGALEAQSERREP